MHRSSNTASARASIHLIPELSNRSPTTYRAAPSTTPEAITKSWSLHRP
jgi:hypothetical protein